jgi:hypothetical protein
MKQRTAMSKLHTYIQVAHDLGAKQVDSLMLLTLITEFKELEREQIKKSYIDGYSTDEGIGINPEDYYNEKYTK